jgi:hypothetical protein
MTARHRRRPRPVAAAQYPFGGFSHFGLEACAPITFSNSRAVGRLLIRCLRIPSGSISRPRKIIDRKIDARLAFQSWQWFLLVELNRMGHKDIAKKGVPAYWQWVRESRAGEGEDTATDPEPEKPTPLTHEYWAAQAKRHLGEIVSSHTVKYPYSGSLDQGGRIVVSANTTHPKCASRNSILRITSSSCRRR